MKNENIIRNLARLDDDPSIQNQIAQVHARYILLNTSENVADFPRYTIIDDNLNLLALQYLNLGCCFAENKQFQNAIAPLERGAGILEAIHSPQSNKKNTSNYYGVISSLAYYVSFQYSKAFILIAKFQYSTPIASLIRSFIQRNFKELNKGVYEIITSNAYSDNSIAQNFQEIGNRPIYEVTIAKSLDAFVKYFQSGQLSFLERARFLLENLKKIADLEDDPGIWWVIRLLLLIMEGFNEASVWNVLNKYFDIESQRIESYIKSLVYKEPWGIYELFLSQRGALPKVLNKENEGCVVSIPTSSGKTRIAEIAILNCLQEQPDSKVLYIAPYRSLAFEVENSLESILEHSDIVVSHLYGGMLFTSLDEMAISDAQVIIATPEKAKALLRGNIEITKEITLAIIDEGHLLGDNKRLIMNEIFYEELKYFIQQNNGRFLLLSAVLPNADDIAEWLTGKRDDVFKDNWRPSDERLGILEWRDNAVNINWENQDKERNSYNRRFIVANSLPKRKRERIQKYFPGNKNEAVAATAYKLRNLGPVLIFVGRKNSVFVMAQAYMKSMGDDAPDYHWKNMQDWRAFELACNEAYGPSNNWLIFARKGILCHNADLHADVRLPIERLMRSDKPLVIISTSTLGQGVNLGVSTVIFSTLHQANGDINARDFWNIAGRAGRAFVDNEGKILVALDSDNMRETHRKREINKIRSKYFNKEEIDIAKSGILSTIEELKEIANKTDTDFQLFIQLIAENKIEQTQKFIEIENKLDSIDDSLLSLQLVHNPEGVLDVSWAEQFFKKSLSGIQAESSESINSNDISFFFKSRIDKITQKVGVDRNRWISIVQSGLPLNSELMLEEKLPSIIDAIKIYLTQEKSIDNKIKLLKEIEKLIANLPILNEKDNLINVKSIDIIREQWLKAVPIAEILGVQDGLNVVTNLYTYSLPWTLNGICQKLKNLEMEDEASVVEELAILVESGLPSMQKVKLYQAGIRSRYAANEIGDKFQFDFGIESISDFKRELLNNAESIKPHLSPFTGEWIDMLSRYSKMRNVRIKYIPPFQFDNVNAEVKNLVPRNINGEQYFISPDLSIIEKINIRNFDFSEVNNVSGIEFIYDETQEHWKIANNNPYIKIIK